MSGASYNSRGLEVKGCAEGPGEKSDVSRGVGKAEISRRKTSGFASFPESVVVCSSLRDCYLSQTSYLDISTFGT